MSDFEILKALQSEFILTLEERKKSKGLDSTYLL